MPKATQRTLLGRGKGYLNAAGSQARFIIFLIFVLVAYTLLLRVFQKLAEILQLPVFLPFSLVSLLLFIGVVGTIYSHAFLGPMVRIRRAIEQLAKGEIAASLRLRESDDPMLKELVSSLDNLCEHTRNTQGLIYDSAHELFSEIEALQAAVDKNDTAEIRKHQPMVRKKQELLEKAVHSFRKQ